MPKASRRKRLISSLLTTVKNRFFNRVVREFEFDDDSLEDAYDSVYCRALSTAQSNRYISRQKYRKSSRKEQTFAEDLQTSTASTVAWLTDDEFKQKYRMDRESFDKVLELIKDHRVFQTSKTKKALTVENQLIDFLVLRVTGQAIMGYATPFALDTVVQATT